MSSIHQNTAVQYMLGMLKSRVNRSKKTKKFWLLKTVFVFSCGEIQSNKKSLFKSVFQVITLLLNLLHCCVLGRAPNLQD